MSKLKIQQLCFSAKKQNKKKTKTKNSPLYSSFILNLYTVYELNIWPHNPTDNFTLKNCLFGTVKLIRNTDKSKFTYNGQGIAFDGKGFRSFDNDTARNVIIFDVDNRSSSHVDNPKSKKRY